MGRKYICVYVFLLLMCLLFAGCYLRDDSNLPIQTGSVRWIEEKSYLVDCTIEGDKVLFKYAVYFCNDTEFDWSITHCTATFDEEETKDWLSQNDILTGWIDNANRFLLIKSNTEGVAVFTFEGNYSGGSVTESLSFPHPFIIGINYEGQQQDMTGDGSLSY